MAQLYNLKAGTSLSTDLVATAVVRPLTAMATDGAVTIAPEKIVVFTKAGVLAATLGIPTTAQNGTVMTFVAATANAHTVTAATIGFNAADGAGDVATFGGAIGDNFTCIAYGGEWLVLSAKNVTFG
jgi:hypothetical protein